MLHYLSSVYESPRSPAQACPFVLTCDRRLIYWATVSFQWITCAGALILTANRSSRQGGDWNKLPATPVHFV